MGTVYPPDGFTIAVGTWGTDADVQTTTPYMGKQTIKLIKHGAVVPEVYSAFFPVRTAYEYSLVHPLALAAATAGTDVSGGFRWYDSAQAYLSSSTCYTKTVNATDFDSFSWGGGKAAAPASAAYAKAWVKKNTAAEDSVLVGPPIVEQLPYYVRAIKTATASISTGTWTDIGFDSVSHSGPLLVSGSPNNVFIPVVPGIYAISFTGSIDGLTDGQRFGAGIYVASALVAESLDTVGAAGDGQTTVSAVLYLDGNSGVKFQVWHNHGSNLNTYAGEPNMSAGIVRIRG